MKFRGIKNQDGFRIGVASLFSIGLHAALLFAILPSPVLGHTHHGNEKSSEVVMHDLDVAKGETHNGDLVTSGNINVEGVVTGDCVALGGAITVTGSITGDITAVGGPIFINGPVTGDIASTGGEIVLGPKAVLTGDVTAAGGKLTKEKGAQVTGNISEVNLPPMAGKVLDLLKTLGVTPPSPVPGQTQTTSSYSFTRNLNFKPDFGISFFLFFFLAMGFVVLLVAVLLPKPVGNIAGAIRGQFWKSAAIGLLIHVFFIPGLLLLCISIIGIALIPLVVLLYALAWLLGLVAFGLVLTGRACETLKRSLPPAVPAILIGYVLLNSLTLLGEILGMVGSAGGTVGGILIFTNFIFFSCALMVGLGAAWSTRLGSRALPSMPPAVPPAAPPPAPVPSTEPPTKRKKRSRL